MPFATDLEDEFCERAALLALRWRARLVRAASASRINSEPATSSRAAAAATRKQIR